VERSATNQAVIREISTHKFDALRAIVSGWFVFFVWVLVMSNVISSITTAETLDVLSENVFFVNGFNALLILSACVTAVLCGWLLLRLHRANHRAMILLFAGTLILVRVAVAFAGWPPYYPLLPIQHIFASSVHIEMTPFLWIWAAGNPLVIVCLLVGGGIFKSRNSRGASGV